MVTRKNYCLYGGADYPFVDSCNSAGACEAMAYDNAGTFEIENFTYGRGLSSALIQELVFRSCKRILTYCLERRLAEFTKVMPLGTFASIAMVCKKCKCVLHLLKKIEEVAPGTLANYRDEAGSSLLYCHYMRYDWCIDTMINQRKIHEFEEISDFLLECGCSPLWDEPGEKCREEKCGR